MLLIERPLENGEDREMVRAALAIRRSTDPSAVVAVSWAGAIPYFSERPAIDLLGKMDRRIAHEPMHVPTGSDGWIRFVPGHLKWDYSYSIGLLKPDIILERRFGRFKALQTTTSHHWQARTPGVLP